MLCLLAGIGGLISGCAENSYLFAEDLHSPPRDVYGEPILKKGKSTPAIDTAMAP